MSGAPGSGRAQIGAELCSWCGGAIDRDDGYRLAEQPGERRASFCRLEHLVPWALRGPHWEAGEPPEPRDVGDSLESCSRCAAPLGDVRVVLVRHRGPHRIPDGFCSLDHAAAWARAGGRWQ